MQKFNIILNVDMTISQTYSLFVFAKKISMVMLKFSICYLGQVFSGYKPEKKRQTVAKTTQSNTFQNMP